MMRLFLCYFFLTVFPFFTIAQSSDKKKIEQVILESEHLSDTSQLWAFFDQQIKILPNFQKDL